MLEGITIYKYLCNRQEFGAMHLSKAYTVNWPWVYILVYACGYECQWYKLRVVHAYDSIERILKNYAKGVS